MFSFDLVSHAKRRSYSTQRQTKFEVNKHWNKCKSFFHHKQWFYWALTFTRILKTEWNQSSINLKPYFRLWKNYFHINDVLNLLKCNFLWPQVTHAALAAAKYKDSFILRYCTLFKLHFSFLLVFASFNIRSCRHM